MRFDCNPQYNPQPSGPSEVRAEGLDLGGLLLPDRNRDLGGEILKRGEAIVLFDELTYRTFEPLRTGSAAAVVVRGYLPTDVALQYAQKILTVGRSEIGPYANLSDDLRKIGRTLFESTAGGGDIVADGIKGYLDAAEGYRRKLAALTSEIGAWPMERIRHDLHDALGAEPLRLMDREAFAGLVRVVANGGQIKPHQDDLAREFPDLPFAASLSVPGSVQVAGNLYLQLPDEGGALRLWNRRLSRAELKSMRCPSSDYGVDEKLVGAPIVEYVPKPGDLMFFDSTKLHAVSPSQGRERVSISFFMGMSPVETRFWS